MNICIKHFLTIWASLHIMLLRLLRKYSNSFLLLYVFVFYSLEILKHGIVPFLVFCLFFYWFYSSSSSSASSSSSSSSSSFSSPLTMRKGHCNIINRNILSQTVFFPHLLIPFVRTSYSQSL